MTDIAIFLITDSAGRVLMQHRDDNTPHDPQLWAVPGGQVEPGEEPVEAAHRELFEEAGLTVATLRPIGIVDRVSRSGEPVRFHLFTGTTDATQDDVVLGEGQAMLFLTIPEIRARPLAAVTVECLRIAGLMT